MTRRIAKPGHADRTLHALLSRDNARVPLETALHVAWQVVTAITVAKERGANAPLDAADLEVHHDGTMSVRRGADNLGDESSEVAAVGSLLYRLFTGVNPAQALARIEVPRLHEPPPPSALNPALDDTLDRLIVSMLSDESQPTLRVVESVLASVLEDLGVEPSVAEVARWAADDDHQKTQPCFVIPAAVLKATKAQRLTREPPRSWQLADEGDDEVSHDDAPATNEAPRFDAWAAALCVFSLAIFAMAFTL